MPRPGKTDDLKKLEGPWSLVKLEIDGREMPAPGARIVIQGNTFRTEGMGADFDGRVDVDSAAEPKTFDLQFTSGPEEGNTNLGIYELEGDRWKICLDMTGTRRPAAFESGPGVALEVFQRGALRPAAAVSQELPPGGPTEDIQGEWALAACIREGTALPEAMVRSGKRTATADEITVTLGKQVIVQAKYRVNREVHPNAIDYLMAEGQLQYGIFQVEGDTLKTCFAPPGKPRPEDFETDSVNQRTFTQWKRVRTAG